MLTHVRSQASAATTQSHIALVISAAQSCGQLVSSSPSQTWSPQNEVSPIDSSEKSGTPKESSNSVAPKVLSKETWVGSLVPKEESMLVLAMETSGWLLVSIDESQ